MNIGNATSKLMEIRKCQLNFEGDSKSKPTKDKYKLQNECKII